MALTLSSGPATEPITVPEIKDHTRVSITADDALLLDYIKVAREELERALGSAFITQTWVLKLDAWPASEFLLPKAPLQSITSIQYTDEDGNTSTYSSSNYLVDTDSKPGRVTLKTGSTWPTDTLQENNGVIITFVAGYGGASDVPHTIVQALRLMVAEKYEHREPQITESGLTRIDIFDPRAMCANYDYRSRERVLT